MKPFELKPYEQPNAIQKMLKQIPKINAFIEVNNLLASNEIDTIRTRQIDDISTKYGFDVLDKHKSQLLDLYKLYLNFSLSTIDEIDIPINTADKLVTILKLDKKSAEIIWLHVTKSVLEDAYSKVVADARLTEKESNSLDELGQKLRIPDTDKDEISQKIRTKAVQEYVDKIISDGRISPEEETELDEMAKSLKVNINMEENTKKQFEKMKILWKIENEDLPILIPDINLPKKEICFFSTEANWYEYRVASTRFNYSGPTFRVKIMKGVYYRAGQMSVNSQSQEVLKKIGHGKVYITSKKIFFYGENWNFSIPLGKIIDLDTFSNGVDIKKDVGKNVFIGIDTDAYLFAAILSRVMTDNS